MSNVESGSLLQNETLNPLDGEPVINNVTANAHYFKNGDLIDLFVTCDRANYSLFANFSIIDDKFSPSDEQVLDYNNGIYRINYTLDLSNIRPDGTYQVIINVTNSTTSQFTLYNDMYLTLDNTVPTLKDIAFAQSGGLFYIFGNANGTFSPIKNFTHNIPEFNLTTDPTGELSGLFVLKNSIPLLEGNYPLIITITDSVNLTNSLDIPLTVDMTPPTFDKINRTPLEPEYDEDVQVTIYNASDAITGIKSITLYYSIDGNPWTQINITGNRSGIIPQFQYNTEVLYYIELLDNYPINTTAYENFSYVNNDPPNMKISETFNYTVNDTRPPVVGPIQGYPLHPTQHMTVNISIAYVYDTGSGIANISLSYSVDGGIHWNSKDITKNQWGIIEAQPPFSTVYYQIIVIDKAGNKFTSEIISYVVQFDITRLLVFLIIIGAVVGISTYSGKVVYSRRKQKSLQMKFLEEKEEFKTYIDFRLADIEIILNDIGNIELNIDNLLQFQWAPPKGELRSEKLYRYRLIKEFAGITQLSTEIKTIRAYLDLRVREINKKFHILKPFTHFSQQMIQFYKKIDVAINASGHLIKTFRKKYPIFLEKVQSYYKIEFPLDEFDRKFAGCINEFQGNYKEFAREFDQLLISRQIRLIETHIDELDLIFNETDEWLKNAENWSKILPLPKDRGYKYLLKLKKERYLSVKNKFEMKIEKFRAELTSSILFAQNFIKWNYDNLKNRLKKFEKVIFEDSLRFISSEEIESSKINLFLEEKFNYFNSLLEDHERKIDEFVNSHKEFSIQGIYNEWTTFVGEVPSKLKKIKHNLDKFTQPLYRISKLIKGITNNFYKESLASINKHQDLEFTSVKQSEKLTPLNILFSKIVWKINRIDNKINDWINLLPFDLETPQLVILLRDWNEVKEEVLEKFNTLSKEQRIYKCEIIHEILDPLNDEIWECSNCGAIACTEHLERWYHRKKSPECFKCGKTNTFTILLK